MSKLAKLISSKLDFFQKNGGWLNKFLSLEILCGFKVS